jgi:hypothetical protein
MRKAVRFERPGGRKCRGFIERANCWREVSCETEEGSS